MESPLINKAAKYNTIEYQQQRNLDLYLGHCGTQQCLPGYAYPRCVREGYHLHVVLSGCGTYQVGDKIFSVHAGQMFLLKDREEVFYQADEQDPWTYVWVTFRGFRAAEYLEMAGFTDGVYVLDCNVDPTEFQRLVLDILGRPHMRISSEITRFGLALQFLGLANESWEKSGTGNSRRNDLTVDDYVQYAVQFIRSNYQQLRIRDVAEYIGINRTYLTEIFTERMYMSPQEYLIQVRLSKAKELLRQTDLPINTVAREVGYEDQMSFSKIFKKRIGISPQQYRKE